MNPDDADRLNPYETKKPENNLNPDTMGEPGENLVPSSMMIDSHDTFVIVDNRKIEDHSITINVDNRAKATDVSQENVEVKKTELDGTNAKDWDDWRFNQRVADSPLNGEGFFDKLTAGIVEGVGSMVSAPDQAPGIKNWQNIRDFISRNTQEVGGIKPETQEQKQKGPKQ